MKKLGLLAMVLLMAIGGIYAQQKQVNVSSRIDPSVPKKVIAAIKTEYPTLRMHQHPAASADEVKKETKVNRISSWPSQTYHVQYKGRNYFKKEVYDQEGHLLHSKESIFNIAMPHAVYRYIGKTHNGWLVKKTEVVKTIETGATAPGHTINYKVVLQNGKKKQRLLLNVDVHGEIYAHK